MRNSCWIFLEQFKRAGGSVVPLPALLRKPVTPAPRSRLRCPHALYGRFWRRSVRSIRPVRGGCQKEQHFIQHEPSSLEGYFSALLKKALFCGLCRHTITFLLRGRKLGKQAPFLAKMGIRQTMRIWTPFSDINAESFSPLKCITWKYSFLFKQRTI